MTGKWMVHTKGGPGKAFEIVVIRVDNAFGYKSWGWFGDDKLLISDSGMGSRVTEVVWSYLCKAACEVADYLNNQEKGISQ